MGTYLQTTFARWKEKFLSLTKYPYFHFYLFIHLFISFIPTWGRKKVKNEGYTSRVKNTLSSDRSSDLA